MSFGWKLWLVAWALVIAPGVVLGFIFAEGFPEPPVDPVDFGLWMLIWLAFLSPLWLVVMSVARRYR